MHDPCKTFLVFLLHCLQRESRMPNPPPLGEDETFTQAESSMLSVHKVWPRRSGGRVIRGEALTCMESPSPAQPSCCISHLPSSHLTLAKPDSSQSLNLPLSFPLRCCLHECAFPHILTCVLCNSTHFPSFLEDLS